MGIMREFPMLRPGTAFLEGISVPVGVAARPSAGGQEVPVILHGVSDHHSGLQTGKLYYALPDGGLTSQPTPVRAGLALSPTELLVDIER